MRWFRTAWLRSARLGAAVLGMCALSALGCASEEAGDGTGWRKFDACAPLMLVVADGANEMQAGAVAAGAAMWNQRARTHLQLNAAASTASASSTTSPPNAQLFVRFQRASIASFGFYDPDAATISINDALVDPHELAVTLAHEAGHAFGLPHVEGDGTSVMKPANRTVEPGDADVAALITMWGSCGDRP